MSFATGILVVTLTLVGCGEDWPVELGGPFDDFVLAVKATDSGIVAAGVRDKSDASPLGRVAIDGIDLDATHHWSLQGRHDGAVPSGLARSVDAIPGTSDVIVGGEFAGVFDLGALRIVSADQPGFEREGGDLWIARVGVATGEVEWLRRLGGPALDSGPSLSTSTAGIAVTGRFHNQIDLGGGPLFSVDGPGTMDGFAGDVFVAVFDLEGTHHWSRSGGGLVGDTPSAIRIDTNGEVIVAGTFGMRANFGGMDMVSQGSGDAFIARYGRDGSHIWSIPIGGPESDSVSAIALDPTETLFAVGGFVESPVDFGGGERPAFGGLDGFVALYHMDGTHVWSVTIGGSGRDSITDVVIDGDTVVATGKFEGVLDLEPPLAAAGETNGFVVWLDVASGRITKATALGGANTSANSLSIAPHGTFVGGFFSGDAELNGSASSRGGNDGFVARF